MWRVSRKDLGRQDLGPSPPTVSVKLSTLNIDSFGVAGFGGLSTMRKAR